MKVTANLYQVDINSNAGYGKVSEEEFLSAQEKFKGLEYLSLATWDSERDYGQNALTDDLVIVSEDQIVEMAVRRISFQVKQEIKTDINISQQLHDLASKPIAISTTTGGDTNYNNKCEVHIPNLSMLMYNELMLKEDVCTDELQSCLNSGWRMIAVCPQPDQRRPDYILGRYNPDMEIGGHAER